MTTLPIVEHFDPFEDVLFGFFACTVLPVMHEFFLERAEEAFHTGVVPQGQAARSQQLPLRLMEHVIACSVSRSW